MADKDAIISNTEIYDIDDLVRLWEKDWREVAKLLLGKYPEDCTSEYLRLRRREGNFCPNYLWRDADFISVWLYFKHIFRSFCKAHMYSIGVESLLVLAVAGKKVSLADAFEFSSKKHPAIRIYKAEEIYTPLKKLSFRAKKNDFAYGCKVIRKLIRIFISSENWSDVLTTLATKENQQLFLRDWSYNNETSKTEILAQRIPLAAKKAMKNVIDLLDNKVTPDEAWWKSVCLAVEPRIEKMLEIKHDIDKDVPLTNEQFMFLNEHSLCGSPKIELFKDQDGRTSSKLVLVVAKPERTDGYLNIIATALLVQPAFLLAQQLQSNEPRFEIICHAPSCGKRFYAGRKDANACPPTKNKRLKSICAKEVLRYKGYLRKIGESHEIDLSNEKLKQDFIAYDNS